MGRPVLSKPLGKSALAQPTSSEPSGPAGRVRALRSLPPDVQRLVCTVAHDLKAPLLTIIGFAARVSADQRAGRADAVAEGVERIAAAAERMSRQVDELLQQSSGDSAVHAHRPMKLASVLRGVLDACGGELARHDVQVESRFHVKSVFADPARLERALQNLLCNAFEHGCVGSTNRVEVGSVACGGEVRLYVRDNGPGIPPEHHERIFRLFEHLGEDRDSSGIGLAMVRQVAKEHGGRAWVESTPGQGATFWLSFPHAAQVQGRDQRRRPAA